MKPCLKLIALAFAVIALAQAQPQKLAPEAHEVLRILHRVDVTVLVDNISGSGPVLGEWGAALLIQTGQDQILFDAGEGRVLLGNARALQVDLRKTKAIVVSHNHLDHTGGLTDAFKACGPVDFFMHPAGFETGYWKEDSHAVAHSLPFSRQLLGQRVRKLIETKGPTAVCSGVMVTGQIPRLTDFEDTGLKREAFLDKDLKTPDPILDDQALFFRVPEGVVVVMGCGHAGLVNTLRYISEILGQNQIYAVIGGTHLISASAARMQKTVDALRSYGVQKVMLSHCTGVQAYAVLANAFPGRCSWPSSGTKIQFGRQ